MARRYGRSLCSRWHDGDWTILPIAQQWVYDALTSQDDISWCGVLPYVPQRLATLAPDMTGRKAAATLQALASGRFVIIDHESAELLVRSFIRHEEPLTQPNLTRAVIRAYDKVHSGALRAAIRVEIARLHAEAPEMAGWRIVGRDRPDMLGPIAKPLANPSANGHAEGTEDPSQQPSTLNPQPSTAAARETQHHVVQLGDAGPRDAMMRCAEVPS